MVWVAPALDPFGRGPCQCTCSDPAPSLGSGTPPGRGDRGRVVQGRRLRTSSRSAATVTSVGASTSRRRTDSVLEGRALGGTPSCDGVWHCSRSHSTISPCSRRADTSGTRPIRPRALAPLQAPSASASNALACTTRRCGSTVERATPARPDQPPACPAPQPCHTIRQVTSSTTDHSWGPCALVSLA
jgi:hypothetical protein